MGPTVTMSNGEAVVGVDAQQTTRLAVHGGSAAFAAALSTVTVAKGFGSKAENGKPPTPPRPLPAAPVWSSAPPEVVFADAAGKARVVARYGDSALPGKPKAASFRVRVARDPSMDDLVSDTVVPAKVTELDARNLPVGAYFLRVSTIDDDKFESPVGPIAKVVVASAQLTETTPGLARLSVSPSDVVCTIDGAAGTTEVDGTRSHGIVCQLDARDQKARGGEVGKAPGTVTLPAVAKPLELRVSAAERGARDGEGRVTIDLAERSGAPASAEGVEVTATNGVNRSDSTFFRTSFINSYIKAEDLLKVKEYPDFFIKNSSSIRAAAKDTIFLNETKFDFRLDTNAIINNKARYIDRVQIDILNVKRDLKNPDIGCYELK